MVGLDVGDIAKGFGPQAELKFQTAVEGMRKMGYDGITLGCTDLRLPAGLLTSVVAAVNNQPSPFVSANVGLFGFDAKMISPYRIVEAGGKKFGITGVLGKSCQKQIHNSEIEMSDPETALKQILPEMKQKADYLILLANATPEESTDLAKQLPEFDLVVTAGGRAEPPAQPTKLNHGKTLLVEVGEKGENAVVVAFFADPKHPVRYQRVPLDSRFPASPAMKQLMAGLPGPAQELRLRRPGHPRPCRIRNGRPTAASSARRPARSAMKTPTRRGRKAPMPRPTPPWPTWTRRETSIPSASVATSSAGIPASSFPTRAATKATRRRRSLENVGCEDCHGPGEHHVAAEHEAAPTRHYRRSCNRRWSSPRPRPPIPAPASRTASPVTTATTARRSISTPTGR